MDGQGVGRVHGQGLAQELPLCRQGLRRFLPLDGLHSFSSYPQDRGRLLWELRGEGQFAWEHRGHHVLLAASLRGAVHALPVGVG